LKGTSIQLQSYKMSARNPAPIVSTVETGFFPDLGLELNILRLDEMHPGLTGNKWYKLKYNLEEMRSRGLSHLVTYGGAYSNHIAATAAAGSRYGFKTTGIIRGEPHEKLNSTLTLASEQRMNLLYVDREKYRDKKALDNWTRGALGDSVYILPEGGSNELAVKGCQEILDGLSYRPDIICCSCGTGATIAGIASCATGKGRTLGFSALRDTSFFPAAMVAFGGKDLEDAPRVIGDYHFGGYGKVKPELIQFVKDFRSAQGIQLDYIYTGKMMYGIFDLAGRGFFNPGTRILAIHTGGVQGNAGFEKG
jgi:1-aminocyclopropane-1-carboxylate deaminase